MRRKGEVVATGLQPARDGKKWTKAERTLNRQKIAEMRLRGVHFRVIAQELGYSLAQTYQEYKEVERMWLQAAFKSLERLKAIEVAKLEEVERVAWERFEASQQESQELRREFMETGDGQRPVSAKATRKSQVGDPRWLQVVLDCIERRIKLLGLEPAEDQDAGAKPIRTLAQHGESIEARLARYSNHLGVISAGPATAPALGDGAGKPLDTERSAP